MNLSGKTGTKRLFHKSMLDIQDYLRYSKPMLLPEIGSEGQEKIKQAKVLVIGAGGLGCPILLYLAASGVGTLGVVDFDEIVLSNLHRQILYTEYHLGKSKALQAKETLSAINPNINIITHPEKITPENCEQIINSYDIVIDGCDNFSTRYLVNDTCVTLNKPLVYGSILKFEGQLAIFNHQGSKNLRDLFPEPPNPEDVPSCSQNGVLGTLPGIIGTMMAQETLKLIVGLPCLINTLVIFDTLAWRFTKLSF